MWKVEVRGPAAVRAMRGNYITHLNVFREMFPCVTLVGYEEVVNREADHGND